MARSRRGTGSARTVGLGLLLLTGLAICASACGSTSPSGSSKQINPVKIYPGPAGLLAGSSPSPNGTMWLLANERGNGTLRTLDLHAGVTGKALPVSPAAIAIAEN